MLVHLSSIQTLGWSLRVHSSLGGGRFSHLGCQAWQHHLFLEGGHALAIKVSKTRADCSCHIAVATYS